MMFTLVNIQTVPGSVMFATVVTIKTLLGHMSLNVVPYVPPDIASLATHQTLQLPRLCVAQQRVNFSIQLGQLSWQII